MEYAPAAGCGSAPSMGVCDHSTPCKYCSLVLHDVSQRLPQSSGRTSLTYISDALPRAIWEDV